MVKTILYHTLLLILLFFCFISIWAVGRFGNIDIEKLIFHLCMPLKGATSDWATGIYKPILCTFITWIFILGLFYLFKKRKKYVTWVLCPALLLWDCFYIDTHFSIMNYMHNLFSDSSFIEQHYKHPNSVELKFPENKKNLIFIMVESLETSYQNEKNGGLFKKNYIPELTKIAKENISFSHSNQIEGASVLPQCGWTIAALVAETAGLPLKLWGFSYINNTWFKDLDNTLQEYQYFLPGALSLGDILHKEGYQNYLIMGTNSTFAGQHDYFTQHGNYTILDKEHFKLTPSQRKKKKYHVPDKNVFNLAKTKLAELDKNTPFHMIIKTNDTHFGAIDNFVNTSKIIGQFLNWLKKQPYYNNTVIVILGDHCNMQQTDFNGIETTNFRYNGNIKRKVYNAFINTSIPLNNHQNRKFATIDMFPTMLAAIGVEIQGNKLGLGTNLFSGEKTLLELYGYEYVFEELNKTSYFYNNKLLYK